MAKRLVVVGFALIGSLCACSVAPQEGERASAQLASAACDVSSPTASGEFVASGNESPDPFGPTANPIVSVTASGHELTFTAKNGEHGTITLSGATATGSFQDDWGLAAVWLAPFDGAHPYPPPVKVMQLSGGAGVNHALSLEGAAATTRNGSFMFSSPFEGSQPYVVGVKGTGNTIAFTDAWGATATITLSGVQVCAD